MWKKIFTTPGDHVAYSIISGGLKAYHDVCWFDWDVQIASMEKLLSYEFTHILPGHGYPFKVDTSDKMKSELEKLISRMCNLNSIKEN